MSKEEKPRIKIDRYGSPLGTPPEIYRDCIDNNKNDINHGNIHPNNQNEQSEEKKNIKDNYYAEDPNYYDQTLKTNSQINFSQNNNFTEYNDSAEQQQREGNYENVNMGIPYQDQEYNEKYDYNKQESYTNPREFYDDERYDFSNQKHKTQPVVTNNVQDQQQQYYSNYDYTNMAEGGQGLVNINDGRLMNVGSNYYDPAPNELPVYVNIKQFHSIRKRKARRDYLDTLMKQSNTPGYLHESRHRHAMNRIRAPSGRFLTKKETAEMMQKRENQDYND